MRVVAVWAVWVVLVRVVCVSCSWSMGMVWVVLVRVVLVWVVRVALDVSAAQIRLCAQDASFRRADRACRHVGATAIRTARKDRATTRATSPTILPVGKYAMTRN